MSMLFVCTVYPQALTFTSARAPWPFDQHAGAPLRQAALPTLVGVPEKTTHFRSRVPCLMLMLYQATPEGA